MSNTLDKEKIQREVEGAFEAMWATNYGIDEKREKKALNQIVAIIAASKEVTEEWIEEKAREMEQVTIPINSKRKEREYFIRSLVEKIRGK